MAQKQVAQPLTHGALVSLPGGRVGEWVSEAEEGTSYRTEHFRTVDSLGLLMRNGAIGSPGGCAVWHVAGLGQSVREWSAQEGWNGRTLNQYEAKGILVGALGVLAVHYGYSR